MVKNGKILSLLLFIILICSAFVYNTVLNDYNQNNYCKGFEEGYKDGYCYQLASCIEPVTPICPVRNIGEENTEKAGYDRGFVMGYKETHKL